MADVTAPEAWVTPVVEPLPFATRAANVFFDSGADFAGYGYSSFG